MTQAIREAERLLSKIKAVATPNTASLRHLRQAASKRLRDASPSVVLAVAKTLIDNERRWLGYELIHHHLDSAIHVRPNPIRQFADVAKIFSLFRQFEGHRLPFSHAHKTPSLLFGKRAFAPSAKHNRRRAYAKAKQVLVVSIQSDVIELEALSLPQNGTPSTPKEQPASRWAVSVCSMEGSTGSLRRGLHLKSSARYHHVLPRGAPRLFAERYPLIVEIPPQKLFADFAPIRVLHSAERLQGGILPN